MRITHRLCFAAVAVFAVGISGCVTSDPVLQDNGSTAWDVSCSYGYLCHEEAQSRCGGGKYVVMDEDSTWGHHRSMRIQCADEYVAAQRPLGPPTMESPPLPPRGRRPLSSLREEERLVCSKAYERFPAVAKAWATQRPDAEPGDEPAKTTPTRDAFLDVCTALTEPQQLCLVATYAAAHRAACSERIGEIPDDAIDALDAILLKPRTPAADASSAARVDRETENSL